MTIHVTCTCGNSHSVDDKHAGKKATCRACGSKIAIPKIKSAESTIQTRPKFCPGCGMQWSGIGRFCSNCGADGDPVAATPSTAASAPASSQSGVRGAPVTEGEYVRGKSPIVALVLSLLIAGLGQLYNGELKKGLYIFGGAIILGSASAGILYPAFLVYSFVDAYMVASGKWKKWT